MRTAILALTPQGVKLARRCFAVLPWADVFLGKHSMETEDVSLWPGRVQTFDRVADFVANAFRRYDAFIFIMATGIVVRAIAPFVKSKLEDPAVVVLDEQANHVISLLSGHVGGANGLTRQLATALGSDPVITTATDTEGLWAPDAVCGRLGLAPWPQEAIVTVNRALLDGVPVRYVVDADVPLASFYQETLKELGGDVDTLSRAEAASLPDGMDAGILEPRETHVVELEPQKTPIDVIVTAEPAAFPAAKHGVSRLYLLPCRLIAGVGCRKGTAKETILSALADATHRIGVPLSAVACIASTAVKREEAGLHAAAKTLGATLQFFETETLGMAVHLYGLEESPFVKETIGVGNVAEAAALAAAGRTPRRMALGKTKYDEKVTVALVWQKLQSLVSDREI